MLTSGEPPTCAYCDHPAHGPGVECEGGVEHGAKRWHRCLCLNLVNAAQPCPPLMTCQGGPLGYADLWYLQQGYSVNGPGGEKITPDVLRT